MDGAAAALGNGMTSASKGSPSPVKRNLGPSDSVLHGLASVLFTRKRNRALPPKPSSSPERRSARSLTGSSFLVVPEVGAISLKPDQVRMIAAA